MVGEASIVKPIITVYESIAEGASFLVKLLEEGIRRCFFFSKVTGRRNTTSLKLSSSFLNILLKF